MRIISIFLIVLVFSVFNCLAQIDNKLKKVDWSFSEKDFEITIKNEKAEKEGHILEIVRTSEDETENLLIKKAEALYPKAGELEDYDPDKPPRILDKKIFSPAEEEAPFWSGSSFDGVKIARIISARAVKYYQELSAAFRSDKKPTRITMSKTSFEYSADVKHHENYKIEGGEFNNVNVVTLNLEWSQYCGDLCALDFERKKVVIFDKNNEPVALFVDSTGMHMVS